MIEFGNYLDKDSEHTVVFVDRDGLVYRSHVADENNFINNSLAPQADVIGFLENNHQWVNINVVEGLVPSFKKYILRNSTAEVLDQSDIYVSPDLEFHILRLRKAGTSIFYEGLARNIPPEYDKVPIEKVWLNVENADGADGILVSIRFIKFVMLDQTIIPFLVDKKLHELTEEIKIRTEFEKDDWRLFPLWRQIKRIREDNLDIADAIKYSQLNLILDDLLANAEIGMIEWIREQLVEYMNNVVTQN